MEGEDGGRQGHEVTALHADIETDPVRAVGNLIEIFQLMPLFLSYDGKAVDRLAPGR
ncbi:hypothetical protein [Actinoplanes awajinensis]|uniref:hypothetical protein n=1 Tax=Actinoplanes awajinensis TaxID=135946 RepID=UPI0012F89BFB|nr:hypothetical protein [Actinoplanes awajinensis]